MKDSTRQSQKAHRAGLAHAKAFYHGCNGKLKHSSKRVAVAYGKRYNDPGEPYRCKSCGGYHLGHSK